MNAEAMAGMMSSATPEWATPRALFDALDAEFRFTIDACAVPENAKCRLFYSPEDDGLSQPWHGRVWCNPPYGRGIGAWIKKAWGSAQAGATVVLLIPSRTDTAWWHDYCARGEVRFLRGRVKFERTYGGKSESAPFPSAIVVFRPDPLHMSGIELIKTFGPIPNP